MDTRQKFLGKIIFIVIKNIYTKKTLLTYFTIKKKNLELEIKYLFTWVALLESLMMQGCRNPKFYVVTGAQHPSFQLKLAV